MSSPNFRALPGFIFIKTVLSSSWPLFIVFAPALTALGGIYGLHWYGILLLVVSFILLTGLLVSFSLIFILVISLVYAYLTRISGIFNLSFRGIVFVSSFIGLAVVLIIMINIGNADLIKMFRAQELEGSASVESIGKHFLYLPTHALAMELLAWQKGDIFSALSFFAFLAVISAVVSAVWLQLSKQHLFLWQKLQENGYSAGLTISKNPAGKRIYYFNGSPQLAIFKKELLMTLRNTKNLLWSCFLFALLIMQMGVFKMLDRNISDYELLIDRKIALIQAMQYMTVIYFICAFTLRFIFTLYSSERKTAWIIGCSPVNQKNLYYSRFAFYALITLLIGCAVWFINFSMFDISFSFAGYSFMIFFFSILFVATLGYSLGALFPNYETDDPGAISTTLPGILFILLSLVYSGLGGWLLYILLTGGNGFFISVYGFFSLLIVALLLLKVPEALTKEGCFLASGNIS